MADGSRARVDALAAGDLVHGGHRVLCTVVTNTPGGAGIVRIGSSESGGWTPNHPILSNGTWYLPGDIVPERHEDCKCVYNFVLETGHILTIGSIDTCTIGHNFTGPVIEHPFYGRRVTGVPHMLDILEGMPGYSAGLVFLEHSAVKRDEQGYVCGFA